MPPHDRQRLALRTCRTASVLGLGAALVAGSAFAAAPALAGPPKPPKAEITGTTWGDRTTDSLSADEVRKYDPKRDPSSLFSVTTAIGAREVWKQKDASGLAVTGQGITVAVVDSGVAPVPGLAGKVVQGPDLSLEVNSTQQLGTDTFGHGTHMAGIIGGRDAVQRDPKSGAPKADDANAQLGVAPDAGVLALKLATTDGSTDVSQVIAGLDWVVQHRRDNGMDVRVVNLSFGTDSVQPYQVDPLAAAAENAWRQGITVVVSGGNAGPDSGGLTNPAIDPYVIAVGASAPEAGKPGVGAWDRPTVADFSSRGTAERHVDLVAPGRSIAGLRAPGSFVDANNPQGLVSGDASQRLFRGSGTSQAAAVVSGAAALLLQAQPSLTPDGVKAALVGTATPVRGAAAVDAGAGQLDVRKALDAVRAYTGKDGAARLAAAQQTWPRATGTGSLELARGSSHLIDPDTGAGLTGEVDVLGEAWGGAAWAADSATGTAWTGGTWNRARWSGDAWTSDGWSRARWSDSAWQRARWSDSSWDGARWSGARWSGDGWQGARWSGGGWA